MAKVSAEKNDAPQIGYPVGSLDEIKAMGIPSRNICTCSERVDLKNAGCIKYPVCDRKFRGTRPQNQLYQHVKADGNVRVAVDACFNIIHKEEEADDKGELITVIGAEGDSYTYRGSVKKHPTRNPDCPACLKGECHTYVDREDLPGIVEPFPPADEHPELVKFARKMDARQTLSVNQRAARKDALLGPDPTPKAEGKK